MHRFLELLLIISSILCMVGATCLSCAPGAVTIVRNVVAPGAVAETQYYDGVVKLSSIPGKNTIAQFNGIYATGFAIDKNHIITAGHFCEDWPALVKAGLIEVQIGITGARHDGTHYDVGKANIVAFSSRSPDICLLRLEDHGLIPIPLALDTKLVQTEDKILLVSAPGTYFPVKRIGFVISTKVDHRFPEEWWDSLFLALDVQPGSSGGPVIWNGKVIGVVVVFTSRLHNGAIAEKVERVHEFLERNLK